MIGDRPARRIVALAAMPNHVTPRESLNATLCPGLINMRVPQLADSTLQRQLQSNLSSDVCGTGATLRKLREIL
jgi:hypothetical protein